MTASQAGFVSQSNNWFIKVRRYLSRPSLTFSSKCNGIRNKIASVFERAIAGWDWF
jgi:hypothetical protein